MSSAAPRNATGMTTVTPATGDAETAPAEQAAPPSYRVLLRGGHVRAPQSDTATAEPTAMLTVGGRVAWIGTDTDADRHLDILEPGDARVDLDGALVTPAFVDGHLHATSAGLALTGLDLAGCHDLTEALDRVAAHAAGLPPDAVVLGQGWDETSWPQRRAPTAAELDRAAGGRPAYCSRVDVHSAVVSTTLLARLPDVPGSAGFDPDGHLRQDAHHLARRAAYDAVTHAQRDTAQRATLARAAALGIAALHECAGPDISGAEDLLHLLALADTHRGPAVFGYWGQFGGVSEARELGAIGAGGDLFVDGAVGSRTALLCDAYADADTHGAGYLTADQIAAHVIACVRAGLQAGFHAIGDAALRAVVDGMEVARRELAPTLGPEGALAELREARVRVEHAELLDADLVIAFARYGLIAGVQPAFDAAWGGESGMYATRLGPARARAMNPFAALAAAGVPLLFGSDAPVTPIDPWGAVHAAVHHRTPEHRLPIGVAFTAATRAGWRALGTAADRGVAAGETGELAVGDPATYAVWRLPEGVPARAGLPADDAATRPLCLRTVRRGHTLHEHPGLPERRRAHT
jgi:predicted amidohydrolase YtcJ